MHYRDSGMWYYAEHHDPELAPIRSILSPFLICLRRQISDDSAQLEQEGCRSTTEQAPHACQFGVGHTGVDAVAAEVPEFGREILHASGVARPDLAFEFVTALPEPRETKALAVRLYPGYGLTTS